MENSQNFNQSNQTPPPYWGQPPYQAPAPPPPTSPDKQEDFWTRFTKNPLQVMVAAFAIFAYYVNGEISRSISDATDDKVSTTELVESVNAAIQLKDIMTKQDLKTTLKETILPIQNQLDNLTIKNTDNTRVIQTREVILDGMKRDIADLKSTKDDIKAVDLKVENTRLELKNAIQAALNN